MAADTAVRGLTSVLVRERFTPRGHHTRQGVGLVLSGLPLTRSSGSNTRRVYRGAIFPRLPTRKVWSQRQIRSPLFLMEVATLAFGSQPVARTLDTCVGLLASSYVKMSTDKNSFGRPDDVVAAETLANHVRCNNSFVHAVFQAQFRSSLTCPRCQRQSNTFDPFLCVSVPVPQSQPRPVYVTVLYTCQQPRQPHLKHFELNTWFTIPPPTPHFLKYRTGFPIILIFLAWYLNCQSYQSRRTSGKFVAGRESSQCGYPHCVSQSTLRASLIYVPFFRLVLALFRSREVTSDLCLSCMEPRAAGNGVKIGVSLPIHAEVRELRELLSSDTGISAPHMLITEVDDLGFHRTFSDSQLVSIIKETDPVYCLELPQLKDATEDSGGAYVLLCWVNVLIMDDHQARFSSPYTMQVGRETSYEDLQKLILKEMNTILHDDILVNSQDVPMFRMRIADGLGGSATYLDFTLDHPLYMEDVEQALALCEEDGGPAHLKLVLEWDVNAKERSHTTSLVLADSSEKLPDQIMSHTTSLVLADSSEKLPDQIIIIADDSDQMEEHASVKQLKINSEQGGAVTLEECFELYTQAEVLGADDAWLCPACNRKQEVVKKLGLWSLPDILVIHLKRFRQIVGRIGGTEQGLCQSPIKLDEASRIAQAEEVTTKRAEPPSVFSWAWLSSRAGCRKTALFSLSTVCLREEQSKQQSTAKLTTLVNFPLDGFDMTPHLASQTGTGPPSLTSLGGLGWSPWKRPRRTPPRYDDNVYDLYAICNHHGQDLQGGHYTAYCRNPYDTQWYCFDDTHVEPVSESNLVTAAAYILFYQRHGLVAGSHSVSSAASSSSSGSGLDHWVYRMPAFNYSPQPNTNNRSSKSQEELTTKADTLDKKSNNSPPTFARGCRAYATLQPTKRSVATETDGAELDRYSDDEAPISPPSTYSWTSSSPVHKTDMATQATADQEENREKDERTPKKVDSKEEERVCSESGNPVITESRV
uniref:ubiquitinyl hydrolase 1 n=1 Tax=Timema monikensis TaxID=170555 RepID=A0A7R9E5T6_9NEOP|nr:unnamed protein product [Timema monikensis]